MFANSLKTKQASAGVPATDSGPKPGDFELGSVESRAAARAIVHRLSEKDGPQPGDIVCDFGFLTVERAAEIYRLLHSEPGKTPVPGTTTTWIQFPFPKGFDPLSVPDGAPSLTLQNAPDDLLLDILDGYNRGVRRAKENGQSLPAGMGSRSRLEWDGVRSEKPAKAELLQVK